MPFHPNLLKAIEDNDPTVTKVHMIGRGEPFVIKSEDVKQLVAAIKKNNNPYVNTILLCDNEIDDEGAEALSGLVTIETLSLSLNKLTDKGAKAIASMRGLKKLDVSNNQIGDEGFIALITNPTLSSLLMLNNPISQSAAETIFQNKTLNEAYLKNDQLSSDFLARVDAFFQPKKPQPQTAVVMPSLSSVGGQGMFSSTNYADDEEMCAYLSQRLSSKKDSSQSAVTAAADELRQVIEARLRTLSDAEAQLVKQNLAKDLGRPEFGQRTTVSQVK